MKILIISKEAWRDEQSGGNVLSNLFKDIDAEFAQIYCNECPPNNRICSSYFQITDKSMAKSLIGKGKAGHILEFNEPPSTQIGKPESFSGYKKWLKGILPILRELVWWGGHWDETQITDFVKSFNPDVIFAPCYGNHYMHRLTRLVHQVAHVNVISYISDDHYTNKQLHWAPWYWINHILLRRHTREIFKHYSLIYTMTEEQKEQCEHDFHANMKILCKAGEFDSKYLKRKTNRPIRFIYAGGIYLNRWKTLQALAQSMKEIDPTGKTFKLDIYTNNPQTKPICSSLNDGVISTIHPIVSMDELKQIYHNSDVALHCESFDLINKLTVRLSFSTKIVDCLDSGCAVMAICDSKQAGLAYLKRNNAALCITSLKAIKSSLERIIAEPEILIQYQHKAFELGRQNHLYDNISKSITDDFKEYAR